MAAETPRSTGRYPSWLTPGSDSIMLDVVVSPRGSRNRIMGVHDARLKIQLAAPPVDGKANEALVRFLASTLDVSRAQVDIVGGPASRRKTVRISGVPPHLVLLKLSPLPGAQ